MALIIWWRSVNELKGWQANGLLHLFDIEVNGKIFKEGDTLPGGYYRIGEVVSRAAVNENHRDYFQVTQKGLLRMEDASKKNTTGAENKNTAPGDGVKYQIREGAEKDVEKALTNIKYTEDVYLTESSPSIMASQKGVKNLPMLMKASHIRENVFTENEAKKLGLKVDSHIHYHGLGKSLFLKVIGGLDEVTLAYRGTKNAENPSRRENYFILISKYKDVNGNVINVPVYIDEKGQYNRVFIDTNKIATVFGKSNFSEYINKEIRKGNLVRIKDRSTQASELRTDNEGSYSKNASDGATVTQENDAVKQQKQERTGVSNRELLSTALAEDAQNPSEKNALKEYKKTETQLRNQEEILNQMNARILALGQYKEATDRKTVQQLQEEALKASNRITVLSGQLERMEKSVSIKAILDRRTGDISANVKAAAQAVRNEYRQKLDQQHIDLVKKNQASRRD